MLAGERYIGEALAASALLDQTRGDAIGAPPRRKDMAEANSRHPGFHLFTPRTLKNEPHTCMIETRSTRHFLGYGLVEFNGAQRRWRSITQTGGFSHLIMAREQPIPAPTGKVEQLSDHSDIEGAVDRSRGLTVSSERTPRRTLQQGPRRGSDSIHEWPDQSQGGTGVAWIEPLRYSMGSLI